MTNARFDPSGKLCIRRGKQWVQAECRRMGYSPTNSISACEDTCAMMHITDAADDDWSVTLCTGAKYTLSSWKDGKMEFR